MSLTAERADNVESEMLMEHTINYMFPETYGKCEKRLSSATFSVTVLSPLILFI